MAITDEGRLEIDSFHSNTPDKAYIREHYYSDKAPGTVAIALLGSAPAIVIGQSMGLSTGDEHLWLFASWVGCAVLAGVLSIGFVALFQLLSMLTNVRVGLATSVFCVFGGMAWPYATLMFSHAHVIGCILLSIWGLSKVFPEIFKLQPNTSGNHESGELSNPNKNWIVFSGFMSGWALNSEYTVGIIVLGVPVFLLGRSLHKWGLFAGGLLFPCILIPIYSVATVGTPWELPYSYQATFSEMQEGLYAIKLPDAKTALLLLFSPARGLLFWSPFLIIAALGYKELHTSSPKLFWMTYLLPIIQIAVISGRVWDWSAGYTFSARYLAPVVPLLAIPCALGLRKHPYLGTVLGVLSILLTGIATITDATPEYHLHNNPLISLQLPLLLKLDFNRNLLTVLFGFNSIASISVFLLLFVVLLWYVPLKVSRKE